MVVSPVLRSGRPARAGRGRRGRRRRSCSPRRACPGTRRRASGTRASSRTRSLSAVSDPRRYSGRSPPWSARPRRGSGRTGLAQRAAIATASSVPSPARPSVTPGRTASGPPTPRARRRARAAGSAAGRPRRSTGATGRSRAGSRGPCRARARRSRPRRRAAPRRRTRRGRCILVRVELRGLRCAARRGWARRDTSGQPPSRSGRSAPRLRGRVAPRRPAWVSAQHARRRARRRAPAGPSGRSGEMRPSGVTATGGESTSPAPSVADSSPRPRRGCAAAAPRSSHGANSGGGATRAAADPRVERAHELRVAQRRGSRA